MKLKMSLWRAEFPCLSLRAPTNLGEAISQTEAEQNAQFPKTRLLCSLYSLAPRKSYGFHGAMINKKDVLK